jgi:predicted nucleic acid-binding protein
VNGIVLDASVTLSWCFPEERTALSLKVLDRLNAGEEALVPSFWSVEVLQAFLGELRALRPTFDHATLEQVFGTTQTICRDHRLTPYDALYIELAMRSG